MVHAVNDAEGMGDEGVAGGGAKVNGAQALQDFVGQPVGGGEGEFERGGVGNAGAVEIGRLDILLGGQGADLGGGTVDQGDADVERAQHGEVEQDVGKILAGDDPAIHADDENLFAEARYVLQDFPQIGRFHKSGVKVPVQGTGEFLSGGGGNAKGKLRLGRKRAHDKILRVLRR